MNAQTISASELKRNAASVLNDVYFREKVTFIERYGKVIAKIVPLREEPKKKKDLSMILDTYFGIAPDFPEVTKDRVSRKKTISL